VVDWTRKEKNIQKEKIIKNILYKFVKQEGTKRRKVEYIKNNFLGRKKVGKNNCRSKSKRWSR